METKISVKDLMMQAFLTGWELSDKSISQDEYLQSSIDVIEVLQVEPENVYAEEGLGLPDGEEVDHLDDLLRADGQWLYYGVEEENFFLIQWYPDVESANAKLAELEAFETYKPDIVIYDVLGDVVCGGFAMPIRGGYAREVFIVSSGEMMALYAASNIAQAIKNFGRRGYARLKGIILNAKNIENEQELVAKAAAEIGTEVVQYVPRSGDIQIAENQGGTVSEFVKDSPMVQVYNELAERVLAMSEDEEE